jgi:hypothetical protein
VEDGTLHARGASEMNLDEPTVITLLTEIRDAQRQLLDNDRVRLAIAQQQANLYRDNLEASEQQRRRSLTVVVVYVVVFGIFTFVLLTHR